MRITAERVIPSGETISARLRGLALARAGATITELLDRRRPLALGLSALAAIILIAAFGVHMLLYHDLLERVGIDYRQYTAAATRWLNGGSFYLPWQLAGPYQLPRDVFEISKLPVLYPPFALVLLVPFSLVPLAAPLWWLIPIGATAIVVMRLNPKPWTWPLLTLFVFSGDTFWLTISGNPVMWIMAFAALGTMLGWPAVCVLLKPTLAPFALFGIWGRTWWVAGFVLIVVAASFGALWIDYLEAISNISGSGVLYSSNNLPMVLIPTTAWLGRGTISHEADT